MGQWQQEGDKGDGRAYRRGVGIMIVFEDAARRTSCSGGQAKAHLSLAAAEAPPSPWFA